MDSNINKGETMEEFSYLLAKKRTGQNWERIYLRDQTYTDMKETLDGGIIWRLLHDGMEYLIWAAKTTSYDELLKTLQHNNLFGDTRSEIESTKISPQKAIALLNSKGELYGSV